MIPLQFEIIIKNGYIYDGTNNPCFKSDIGIVDGKIAKIGRLNSCSTDININAKGLVVAPGFIDIHTHSDFTILVNPKAESSIRQGITTAVIGNCGHSCAPINEDNKDLLKKSIFGYSSIIELNWHTFGEYLNEIKKRKVSQNVASFVGHGTIRLAIMGFKNRISNYDELESMKKLTMEAMKAGAFGISSGLGYPPGSYSNTTEILELCRVVSKYSGIYTTHVRNYSENKKIEAINEAIFIGEKIGIPVHISHYTTSTNAKETLPLMDKARTIGLDITCDLHPYLWGTTTITVLIPKKALQNGIDELLNRLKNHEKNNKIIDSIDLEKVHTNLNGWEKIILERSDNNKEFIGKNFIEIANKLDINPPGVVAYLILNSKDPYNVYIRTHIYREEDIIEVLKHPASMIITDGMALAPYGHLASFRFHPRSYGSFPKVLSQYVRQKRIITLEEAIRKMTSFPAQKLQLKDRGLLKENMWADIVIFNKKTIIDKATYQEPNHYPKGIKYVIVNGKIVLNKNIHTGVLPGKVLLHKSNQ